MSNRKKFYDPSDNALTAKNIYCIGTLRSDRIEKAPLTDLKKQKRGTSHVLRETKTNLVLIRWHDNSQGTIGTNYYVENGAYASPKDSAKNGQKKKRNV
ncbi:unnamed protein product [Phaedon cochleariae]|uniref:PiggyBac transposable element-derived protein domain-containing protein n=1 Tax=Phaedon cochleariae TaxID=80249 RepID=A0A9N9SGQ4_PHACE|nr:unnamed protein product [Phaedon cochleariae]